MTVIVLWPFLLVPWVDLHCYRGISLLYFNVYGKKHCSSRFNYGNVIIGKLFSQSI